MSMDYWGIVGYGVDIDDISKYINHEKVNKLVRELLPDEDFEDSDVMDDDTFYGNPYFNFAEFLCKLDDDKIFDYDDDGQGRAFLLYHPTYAWTRRSNEPSSCDECEQKLIKLLKKVCDCSTDDLLRHVGYINTYGGA